MGRVRVKVRRGEKQVGIGPAGERGVQSGGGGAGNVKGGEGDWQNG